MYGMGYTCNRWVLEFQRRSCSQNKTRRFRRARDPKHYKLKTAVQGVCPFSSFQGLWFFLIQIRDITIRSRTLQISHSWRISWRSQDFHCFVVPVGFYSSLFLLSGSEIIKPNLERTNFRLKQAKVHTYYAPQLLPSGRKYWRIQDCGENSIASSFP